MRLQWVGSVNMLQSIIVVFLISLTWQFLYKVFAQQSRKWKWF